MATYNINTNARREAALTAIVTRLNARRAAATPPRASVSNLQYLQRAVNQVLDSYAEREDFNAEYDGLTQAKRDALKIRRQDDDPSDLGE